MAALLIAACDNAPVPNGDKTSSQEAEIATAEQNSGQIAETMAAPSEPVLSYEDFLLSVWSSEKSKSALFTYLDKDMPDYWDETGWDFYGMSRTPGKGEIACGYFVTTLLKDLGFEIDRIRLAKEPSGVMIKELTTEIKISNSLDTVLEHVNQGPPDAIYIIGLSFHTGFISHSEEGTFFIHSNYINRHGVMREPAATSAALFESDYFMIGNLTANTKLIEDWSN